MSRPPKRTTHPVDEVHAAVAHIAPEGPATELPVEAIEPLHDLLAWAAEKWMYGDVSGYPVRETFQNHVLLIARAINGSAS